MELKLSNPYARYTARIPFNRTTMELKRVQMTRAGEAPRAFNRTTMELKRA